MKNVFCRDGCDAYLCLWVYNGSGFFHVSDHIFGPMEFSRRDLAAVNVMRGRDYGLPDYNTARRAYKLNALHNWSDMNKDLFLEKPQMAQRLQDLYQNEIENVDLYVGGA